MPTDVTQRHFQVGEVVNIPCIVTAVIGTSEPSLTLVTKYTGFNGATDTITVDSKQVIRDN